MNHVRVVECARRKQLKTSRRHLYCPIDSSTRCPPGAYKRGYNRGGSIIVLRSRKERQRRTSSRTACARQVVAASFVARAHAPACLTQVITWQLGTGMAYASSGRAIGSIAPHPAAEVSAVSLPAARGHRRLAVLGKRAGIGTVSRRARTCAPAYATCRVLVRQGSFLPPQASR